MTPRKARGLGRRAPRTRSAGGRRRFSARLRRLVLPTLFVGAAGMGLAALWRARPPVTPGAGEPASRAERRRADTPLSADARAWLVAHRSEVVDIAARFDVSPVALGGIVAAEKTLLTSHVDAVGEAMFRRALGSLHDDDLERWAAAQERAYQERRGRGGGRPTILTPYLWTLGPAQVSLRLAILYEPEAARRMERPERSVREVLEAVGQGPANLEYAAALLADADRAYADVAGVDIGGDPGLMATLYHLGSPTLRARRRAREQALHEREGTSGDPPRTNWYGAFVNRHAAEIAELLEVPAPLSASAD